MTTAVLVNEFNALPRPQTVTLSQKAPNEWHFDIRFVQLEPNPHYILFFFQPRTQLFHIERLPAGLPIDQDGLEFFPDTAEEAAPEVVNGVLYAFINNLGWMGKKGSKASTGFAPWKLTTEDVRLLAAVKKEFRRIGVDPSLDIGHTSLDNSVFADQSFKPIYAARLKRMGYTSSNIACLINPEGICFPEVFEPRPVFVVGNSMFHLCAAYIHHLVSSRPADTDNWDTPEVAAQQARQIMALQKKLQDVPEAVIQMKADNGDPDAALDYGMRLRLGLGCAANRTLSRFYLIRALSCSTASDMLKATAHGAIIDWYLRSAKDGVLKNRYMLASAHHTNAAIVLTRRVQAENPRFSGNVVTNATSLFDLNGKNGHPQLHLLYKDLMEMIIAQRKKEQIDRKKLSQKRLKAPLRYRCAAVGCGVQADTGKMLSRCSGKCDIDKKPSYCSKECQKTDWKNHKPFCFPGAECSVIDDGTNGPGGAMEAGYLSKGSVQIPIEYANGGKLYLSSSTLDPKEMKKLREQATNKDLPSGIAKSFKIDYHDITL